MLLVETMSGLLAGALAYRMRGEGLILALYGSQQPHLEMVNYYNLDPTETAIIQVTVVRGVLSTSYSFHHASMALISIYTYIYLDLVVII